MMLSVSALSSYLYCPRKLFLQKILKIVEPPKKSLILGTIRHEIYDTINKREEQLVVSIPKEPEFQKVLEIYKIKYLDAAREIIIQHKSDLKEVELDIVEVFKNVHPYILAEAEDRAQVIHNFIQKTKLSGQELWNELTPKIVSEISIESKELGLRGIVDRVESYEAGFVPVELKTGRAPKDGMWPGHRIQIIAYMILLEEHYEESIKEGFVHYLDSKEKRHIAMNPFAKEEVLELIKEVRSLLERKVIPPILTQQNKCINCGIREQCHNQTEMQTLLTTQLGN